MLDEYKKSVLERMAKFIVDNGNECTSWSGGKDKDGYARFWFEGRIRHASIILWELIYGPIPEGMYVCHICDTPECLQLTHLKLGTPKQNTADALSKGRMIGPRKVDENMAYAIVNLRKRGLSVPELTAFFEISLRSVYTYIKEKKHEAP